MHDAMLGGVLESDLNHDRSRIGVNIGRTQNHTFLAGHRGADIPKGDAMWCAEFKCVVNSVFVFTKKVHSTSPIKRGFRA